jgi:photosystem II stability/assembly factor-like uncharacterized protein
VSCPLYRAELAVQPQTGELFTWIVDSNSHDEGIFKSSDSGNTWTQIHAAGDGITNCHDLGFSNGVTGCGTDQATFNMVLMAVPTSAGTDVYAGAVNVFRCSITASNPTCQNSGSWVDLTHVYGCSTQLDGPFRPNSHSDQHSIAFVVSQPQIVYFGNDGGVYRSLNAPALTGACNAAFDNLNPHLGPLTQLVAFSQDPAAQSTLQIGSQDNGTAATTDTITWNTIESGDGGYNEIDPSGSGNWFNSGNYVDIAHCAANCAAGGVFTQIVNGDNVDNDAAPFFVPYILDPGKPGQILVGTCRVWRGSGTTSWNKSAGVPISGNFLGTTSSCQGSDDMIRAMAAGGPAGANGSSVIYVGTTQGFLWVTRDSSQGGWSGGPLSSTSEACDNDNARCPISDIALDRSDATGATAYAAVMGFNTPHVYKTTNFGASWTDITANLPDVPANAVLVDPTNSQTIYVGTDIGVFVTNDGGQSWNEYGENLPTVPVTQLRAFPPNGPAQFLRASTYGRGLWQAPLADSIPDFQDFAVVPQTQSLTISAGQAASAVISIVTQNNFSGGVSFSCSGLPAGATCSFSPNMLTNVAGGATTTMTISTLQASTAQPTGPTAQSSWRPAGHMHPFWGALPVFAVFGWIRGERRRRKGWLRVLFDVGGADSDQDWRAQLVGHQRRGTFRRKPRVCGLIIGMVLLGMLSACGGVSKKSTLITTNTPTEPGTATGNYNVTIIATSGSVQKTATITLTVQ